MNHLVRKANLRHDVFGALIGVAGGVLCAVQVARGASGQTWQPMLAVASGWIAVGVLWGLWRTRRSGPATDRRGISKAISESGGVLLWVASWAAVGVCVTAGLNWWRQTHDPLTGAAIRGGITGVLTLLMMTAMKRGWLRGVLFDPQRSQKQRRKREELTRQREEILALARLKKHVDE